MNDANINVLAERVDSALNGFAKIEGMIAGMTAGQQSLTSQIAVFQERLAQVHLTQTRLNNILDEQGENIERVREEQKRNVEKIQEEQKRHSERAESEQKRMSEKIDSEQKRMSEELSGQKLMWKLVGGATGILASIALAMVSWSSQRVDGMTSVLAITDRRLSIVEYAFGIRNSPPTGLTPPTQGTK